MSLRPKNRFCYKTYHSTGEKVPVGGEVEIDLQHVVLEERKIMGDIDHCLTLYSLSELILDEEVREACDVMTKLCKDFRDVHVELKTLLGGKYDESYPRYEDTYKLLFQFVRAFIISCLGFLDLSASVVCKVLC